MIRSKPERLMAGALWAAGCALLYLFCARLAEEGLRVLERILPLGPAGQERLHWGGLLAATVLAALPPLAAARRVLPRGGWGLQRPRHGFAAPALLYLCVVTPLARLSESLPGGGTPAAVLPEDAGALALAFLQLCVASALTEELVFRGAIQGLLAPCGGGGSVILQAAIFGAMHGSLSRAAFALPMGLLFGWAARRSRSIWPGAGLHFFNNAIVFAGLLAAG